MITIDYFGRTGNQIFQWCFGRLFAEKNGLGIITKPPEFFYNVKPALPGKMNMDIGEEIVDDTHRRSHTDDYLVNGYEDRNVRLHGYFQDVKYYQDREKIKGFFELPPITNKNTRDIVIHLRLCDYWWNRVRSVMHPKWYWNIVRKERYGHCYIVVEPHETNRKYLEHLQSMIRRSTVVSKTAFEDFDFIRSFDRIVCSNSTFAWWAAYLSDASKIWTFKPWVHNDRIPLAKMPGAIALDGSFIHDVALSNRDWSDYWNK